MNTLHPSATSTRGASHTRPVSGWRTSAGTPGSRHDTAAAREHGILDAHGIPLALTLTGGDRHDVTQLLPLLDAVPPIRRLRGRPRRTPRELFACHRQLARSF